MSGIKDEKLRWFYRHIHGRGVTADTLAEDIVSCRTYVTEVLNGTEDSPRTRKRLAKLLLADELALLGWNDAGEIVATFVPAAVATAGLDIEKAPSPVLVTAVRWVETPPPARNVPRVAKSGIRLSKTARARR